ncbi:hypothetical protein DYB32_009721 [Aphanomyces invadans]|uniref:Transmembrane protein n=1 Tax=Aphanomyces invadans TaxID=157072 RepID=A0A3R6VEV7_9STRA|nr:hypothetical protein DYB32_009721 [Aphanomyces invadans]
MVHSSIRIVSNLVATGLVVLSLVTIVVLVSAGMFARRANINDITFDSTHFHAFGQTCRLDAAGFVPATCSDDEIATMLSPAWRALGQSLATHWQVDSPLFVTSCVRGPPDNVGWASLTFVAGYDAFPHCVPSTNGPQDIAGLAMAETTVRDEYPMGAYVVTVWSDKLMQTSERHVNTDGTVDLVMSNIKRSLISIDGALSDDVDGINTVITSSPVGGRESKKVVSLTWDTGHVVANATELISIQVLLSLLAMGLISSDFYLTVQGLRGFLQQKPVMTYDLLAGLERRKLLLIVVTLAALPSLLYADVARIYRGTANGDLIWSLSIVLVGMFFTFATLVVLVAVQHVPSPWPCCLVSFSPGVFSYSTIVSLIVVWHSRYESVAIGFNDAPMQLGMNFSGVVRPTGAYSADGAETVVAHNLAGTATAVAVCLAVSVAYSTLVRVSMTGRVFLHTSWTSTNGFLNQCRLPRWITGLPLDQTNAIKIGNKLFCKPSTQAVLGFAVVVDVAADRYHVQSDQSAKTASFSKHTLTLIPVYWLVPTLARVFAVVPPWMTPRIFGTIDKNMFAHSSRDKHLDHRTYVHCRGACVN